jgi:hypothetical protein
VLHADTTAPAMRVDVDESHDRVLSTTVRQVSVQAIACSRVDSILLQARKSMPQYEDAS